MVNDFIGKNLMYFCLEGIKNSYYGSIFKQIIIIKFKYLKKKFLKFI